MLHIYIYKQSYFAKAENIIIFAANRIRKKLLIYFTDCFFLFI